jgi:hypothetical protein
MATPSDKTRIERVFRAHKQTHPERLAYGSRCGQKLPKTYLTRRIGRYVTIFSVGPFSVWIGSPACEEIVLGKTCLPRSAERLTIGQGPC